MRYKITTPEAGTDGRHAGVLFNAGVAFIRTEDQVERRALQYFKKAGYVVEAVDENGEPVIPDPDAEPVDESDEPPPRPPLPADTANKPEWLDAAVLRGYTRDQADAMTKPELIAALKAIDFPTGGDPS